MMMEENKREWRDNEKQWKKGGRIKDDERKRKIAKGNEKWWKEMKNGKIE